MVELAKRLADYTSKAHKEVGGPYQIAYFNQLPSVSIQQPVFPEPPRPLINFQIAVDSKFLHSNVGIPPGYHEVYIRCQWKAASPGLDGNFYVGNIFWDSHFYYDGGPVSFGKTNRVFNSDLVVGPLIRPDDETVLRLSTAFAWSRILRDFATGPVKF
jgi:hypothetical protein